MQWNHVYNYIVPMSYSDTSIVIHLVKDKSNLMLDDTIRIVKNLTDDVFELTYKDNGESLKHKLNNMTGSHIVDYVYLLLKNLTLDEDGYYSLQVSVPAMPRVIVTASKLKDEYYRDHFLELVETGLDMLSKACKLNTKKSEENPVQVKCNNRNNCCYWPNLPVSPDHRYFE